jgi:hypothetical protein
MAESNEVKDLKVFVKMTYEKRYVDKNYTSEVQGNFNEIFDKDITVKIEDVDFKTKKGG